jgi:uncharacterized membrane protein
VEFRIGEVLLRTRGVLSRHALTFLLLVGIADLIPLLLSMLVDVTHGPWQYAQTLLGFALSSFAHGVVVFAAFQTLRGRTVDAMESFRYGAARVLPLVVISLLYFLLFLGGLLLCIAPGLIALAVMAVIYPVCVVERLGPIKSFRRSAALTKGHRWPILAVEVAWWILFFSGVVGTITAFGRSQTLPKELALWAFGIPLTTFQSVFHAMLYHDLRAAKEGIGIEEIAAVFD